MVPSACAMAARASAEKIGFDSAAPSAGTDEGVCSSPSTSAAFRAAVESGLRQTVEHGDLHLGADRPPGQPPGRHAPHARVRVVDQRHHQVDARRADQVLGPLELGLDGVDGVGGDGLLNGRRTAAVARPGDARNDRRQRQRRDDASSALCQNLRFRM